MAPRPKAYSYARMSTKAQLKGHSRERQLDRSRKYAELHNLDLVEDFRLEDIGVSAFRGKNISVGALGRFLRAVEAGDIADGSYLLVELLDRISRLEVRQSLAVLLSIVNAGVKLVTLAEDEQFLYSKETTDEFQLLRSIMVLSRSYEEGRMKSNRLRKRWQKKRDEAGRIKLTKWCPGWLRLADEFHYEALPDRAAIVRSIFEDCAAGLGIYTITRRLNEAGVPPFESLRDAGTGWYSSYVARILNNRAVLGEFQSHRRDENGKPVPDGPIHYNYFPAIFEEELFYRASHARVQRNLRTGNGERSKGLVCQ